MKELWFEGYSDDTFGEVKTFREDHDNCASGKPVTFLVHADNDGLLVIGQYSDGFSAGWQIAVAPREGTNGYERPIADWPMRFTRSDADYSPRLIIEAPDNVQIRLLCP